ncbi:MAG TPA: hypothetical protein VGX25_23995 [Actinophytocola sp.]|uniref:hypothetical protein n=1 Tax=Actinophytocola sp. TaxID=1872138 RepID=UPI002DDCDA4F|nr:hypothetical protein [Actinophytocola sp.]HEV2782467.1 hypothetical protein [Actinophytocola sp.]
MRVERFRDYVRELLTGSGHPDIVRAEFEQVPGEREGLVDLRVDFADGVSIFLAVVRTSPPTGDDFAKPEQPVTRVGATRSA